MLTRSHRAILQQACRRPVIPVRQMHRFAALTLRAPTSVHGSLLRVTRVQAPTASAFLLPQGRRFLSENSNVNASANGEALSSEKVIATPTTDSVESAASSTAIDPQALDALQTNAEGITQTAMQIGDLKAMGLVHNTPVGALQAFLEAIHVWTGVPWWGSIAIATIIIRTALLPLMISIQRNNARLMNINPEMQRIMKNLNTAKQENDLPAMQKYTGEIQQLFRDNKCNPTKSLLLPIVQAPVMISFFMALRSMSALPVPQFQNGGLLWFTDLTVQDPYYILPVVSCAGVMAILEAGTETGAANPQTRTMKNFFRGLTLLMLPFTAWMPSSVFVYWTVSNAFSIGQIIGLRNPTMRRLLNIPPLAKPAGELQKNTPGFMDKWKESVAAQQKQERERILKERQQAVAMAKRASKRRSH
ncbi:hypothetical protein BZG36_03523 [Bifiguratus adelaidae]|uniref:Membrane insertase YidC/Oxa/ALB C-terminal domain-containing protein n=1 Tax=Bifiguratus adelaidae TaxID=1938954 RepID=A0A261XY12_9FUNG|nr:hypothetical protein BZG36_03523 [Bifiguratus adelaidae]